MNTPGQRLRSARRARGLTAADLAKIAGVSDSAVRNQENGTNGIPPARVEVYAEALGVTPNWLMFGEGEAPAGSAPRPEGAALILMQMPDGKARIQVNKVVPMSVALQILQLVEGAEQ